MSHQSRATVTLRARFLVSVDVENRRNRLVLRELAGRVTGDCEAEGDNMKIACVGGEDRPTADLIVACDGANSRMRLDANPRASMRKGLRFPLADSL